MPDFIKDLKEIIAQGEGEGITEEAILSTIKDLIKEINATGDQSSFPIITTTQPHRIKLSLTGATLVMPADGLLKVQFQGAGAVVTITSPGVFANSPINDGIALTAPDAYEFSLEVDSADNVSFSQNPVRAFLYVASES